MIDKLIKNYKSTKCLKHSPYILVMTDKNMPLLSGIEAAKEIRRLQAEGQLQSSLQLLLVTGDHIVDSESNELFDHVIGKPIRREQI
jgi:CheY-like chemotaxis protein